MATFTIEQSGSIIDHYAYLVGEPIEESLVDCKIKHISVAPSDDEQFTKFLKLYHNDENPELALSQVILNPKEVVIVLLCSDRWSGILYHNNIDAYLKRNKIERIYINEQN